MNHCYQISRSLEVIKACCGTLELFLDDSDGEAKHYIHSLKLYRDLLASENQEIFNDESPIKFFNPFAH